jgi:type IV secretion system protein VirB1
MTITLATLMMTCAPLVHPTTLRALIEVESGGNPYAVSINYPQALAVAGIDPPAFAQPRTARAALGLSQSLLRRGFGVSVGLAQINVERLAERHLRIEDLFNPCTNLTAAQRVLLECDSNQPVRIAAGTSLRLRRTLVCYNAGHYTSVMGERYASTVMRAAARHLVRSSRTARSPA